MDDEVAIRVVNVSKTFKLPHEKVNSVKGIFLSLFNSKRTYEKQKVLKNVSFDVKKGEFFGIVGRNGSGKSTLLKLLAGIYTPDEGGIHVNGKLTPFIELGVGFNPELTGRENVYLNGALLGFSRKEMTAMYSEIVEFAELAKFMDQKLKNYSSGMQVRLAFSIAIRAQSDVLILDEVLAVGDEAFQKKCIKVFDEYKNSKQTVVLVTHDMGTVKKYCTRALLIHEGVIKDIGDSEKVAVKYKKINEELFLKSSAIQSKKTSESFTTKIKLQNSQIIKQGEMFSFEIDYSSVVGQVNGIGVAIFKSTGEYIFGANTFLDNEKIKPSSNKVIYSVEARLGTGEYFIKSAIFGKTDKEIIEFIDQGPNFSVRSKDQRWEGIVNLKHSWSEK